MCTTERENEGIFESSYGILGMKGKTTGVQLLRLSFIHEHTYTFSLGISMEPRNR